ncbi:hypothetical protein AVEN_96392-1 [Araneus ventricosus]|uniref:Uncharacterized protein n=1 Tax=Araneus ventricosus TaxID=182803 RepID=A0A4Y2LUI1_ARAVE|nr:hypothetical protein AVEN_96392-1 [Araneus ventricosus]
MNLNFVPSLQHFTLAKIAIALCNNREIKALLQGNRSPDSCESHGIFYDIQDGNYFSMLGRSRHPIYVNDGHPAPHHDVDGDLLERIQGRVSGMISPLNLGRSLAWKILSFIPHIVLEIAKWEEDHSEVLAAGYDAQVYFCWKSVGTIDRESTAENLLNHGNLSVKNRFLLSCLYCMQNHLSSLWNSIYDSYKAHLISECHSGSLLDYWTTHLDGLHCRRSVFPDASYITNVSALRYFYSECHGEDEKRTFLNDVVSKRWKNLDLVCFCVSKLCQNSHGELSSLQCRNILRCFLNWPLQSLFLDVSECLLVKLDHDEMYDLLHDILRIINTHQHEDIDYLNLLKELWEQIPSCHKDSLLNTPDFQPIKTVLEQTSAKSLTPEWYHQ